MARMARLVVPDYPHHVTQRGNRRQQTFFSVHDYHEYLKMLKTARQNSDVDVWAYCLMPNHVHFVVVPGSETSLSRFFAEVHRRYTRRINDREGWCGHLWQERFHSFVMDEEYLVAAVRYIELNPVRAGLCSRPEQWQWSSVRAHLQGRNDLLVNVAPMLDRIKDWPNYLANDDSELHLDSIRKHTRTGRPMGNIDFLEKLESLTGRQLKKRKSGPKTIK